MCSHEPDPLEKFYVFDSYSRDTKENMTQHGTFVLMKFDTLKSIRYYIYITCNSTPFQVLYTETTVQKFDITKHLISKSTLNRQKKISKEKLRKLRQGAKKYQLERKEQIVRELTSFHFNVF